jgi:hypothetical protein
MNFYYGNRQTINCEIDGARGCSRELDASQSINVSRAERFASNKFARLSASRQKKWKTSKQLGRAVASSLFIKLLADISGKKFFFLSFFTPKTCSK